MRAWGPFAAAGLLAALLPGAALAKTESSVFPRVRSTEFTVQATHGYRIDVSASSHSRQAPNIYVTATKGQRYIVLYTVRGVSTKAGTVRAKLPGIGRIAVRFEARKVVKKPVAENCKGLPNRVTRGFFRGTIALRGEQGYMSVHRHAARGKITESFRQKCNEEESVEGGPGSRIRQATLFAGGESGRGSVDFTASRVDFGQGSAPITDYSASSTRRHDGLVVWSTASAQGDPAGFSTPDPWGQLEDATVEPPAPFTGSGVFHLDSPDSSSWTGTLSVELPGVGAVSLVEPQFWSALCEEAACTKTLPPNVGVSFFSSFVRP